jgi:uncharacterized membrane protein YkvA (DUF1232 family)
LQIQARQFKPVLPRNSLLCDLRNRLMLKGANMQVSGKTRLERVRQRVATTLKTRTRQLLNEFRIIMRALTHPGVPWHAKLICGCAVLYVVSPIQLIPNFIPILGQLDDVLIVSIAIKLLKRSVKQTVLDECQDGSDPFGRLAEAGETTIP